MTATDGSREPIFHIAIAAEWAEAVQTGSYRRSTLGTSLDEVGFVHCSHRNQVLAALERFYGDVAEPLMLLQIDPAGVGAPVLEEAPVGAPVGAELFPHVYGPIPIQAVRATLPIRRDREGRWSVPGVASGGDVT